MNRFRLMSCFCASVLCAVAWLVVVPANAQDVLLNPLTSHEVDVNVDSGHLFNNGDEVELVWTDVVEVEQAEWVRLKFDSLALGDDGLGGPSSTLKIISLEDGADQILNAKTAKQWRNTSAYFNGSAVRLELYAHPNSKLNHVHVIEATAGELPAGGQQRTICDGVDDRLPSSDPRGCRLLPLGCSGWLFNGRSNCLLTAGHCVVGNLQVVEFNVPLSNNNGSINFADPDDQYPVDDVSRQGVGNGIGQDWGYFGVFNNSNTGLSPLQAQGDSYTLQAPPSVGGGDEIRITGYGSTSAPVNPQWNQIQKTQVGAYSSFGATTLGYRTDTTGGNSGSPVIFENTGVAIGIHTHGGCGNGGGENAGTGSNHPDLQNALANPQGICISGVGIDFPNGRPGLLDPAGGTTFRVVAFDDGQEPVPGTGVLHYDAGAGFQTVAMSNVSDNVYDAEFPAIDCGAIVSYYVSVESTSGEVFTSPNAAPIATYSVISAVAATVAFEDNFQGNMGWAVSGNAADGQWQRGVPAGGGDRGDPAADGDDSGACYVTDNVDGNSDVDDGSTILTSPTMDGTAGPSDDVLISYYRWYSNDIGGAPNSDIFEVEISNDNGATWVDLETVGPAGNETGGGWFFRSFNVRDFVTPTNQMRVRFIASDLGQGSVVEAGVDGVKIDIIECGPPPAVTIPPANVTVFRGILEEGTAADLEFSDDTFMSFQPSFVLNAAEAPVWLFMEANLPFEPAALNIDIESRANTPGLTKTTEVFNFSTGGLDVVDATGESFNTDSVVTIDLTTDIADYVQSGSNAVLVRVGWRKTGFTILFPWEVSVDQMVWNLNQ